MLSLNDFFNKLILVLFDWWLSSVNSHQRSDSKELGFISGGRFSKSISSKSRCRWPQKCCNCCLTSSFIEERSRWLSFLAELKYTITYQNSNNLLLIKLKVFYYNFINSKILQHESVKAKKQFQGRVYRARHSE